MAQPKRKAKRADEPAATSERAQPEPLSRRGWAVLGLIVIGMNVPLIHYFLLRPRPEVVASVPFHDDFSDGATVSRHYWSTGGHWRVVAGELLSPGVKNNPLWLKARLPSEVAVEFDVRSQSPEGDIKVEIFGDGSDHASGYVLVHGGWNNSISVIARLDEHGSSVAELQRRAQSKAGGVALSLAELARSGVFKRNTRMRVEANPYPVQLGRTYHWRIERRGGLLSWSIDGEKFMELADPYPLEGPDHDRLGFSSWEAQLYFDNLAVTAL